MQWITVELNQQEMQKGIDLGELQESESKRLGLKDRSFSGDAADSLRRSILAKQFEIAICKWGGGTARIVGINEFHDYPDVGQVNARFTSNPGYGLMLTVKDQNNVPIILGTGGENGAFKLIGWAIPSFVKQTIFKIHQGRSDGCEVQYGFLNQMKGHEACHLNNQFLLPMRFFNKELIK